MSDCYRIIATRETEDAALVFIVAIASFVSIAVDISLMDHYPSFDANEVPFSYTIAIILVTGGAIVVWDEYFRFAIKDSSVDIINHSSLDTSAVMDLNEISDLKICIIAIAFTVMIIFMMDLVSY